MNKSQITQKKFIENILLNASKNKMSKLDTIGSLEMSKLLVNDNANIIFTINTRLWYANTYRFH